MKLKVNIYDKTCLFIQEKVRKNIERSLATQIQEAAAKLRRQQKGLLDKLHDINTTVGSTDLDINSNDVYFNN